ncbi:Histidine kinase-, DNA gyrase B-, and HSP90-like ATPase [Filimonas lacunae]|uniref:histidine kinase n=1 Tax=Filimonas lacunae TaxID=477680 RepID=A0A173MS06_9BACT|nr:HAMP domain-containing sensor histidine kinase [Filimonas lacunae]BAV10128.1 sensory box sensor histidine kinase [Filimonas lacunae]SIT19021.1 Histidine kinase-, DNA gyrase B-, and HSP90-like ATPase [Filimonas lacunae]
MTFNRYEWRIAFRVLLLFALLCVDAWMAIHSYWLYFSVIAVLALSVLYNLYKMHMKTLTEIEQFVESIQYRDFSRQFEVQHAPKELQSLRKSFNQVSNTFKVISREKETQYQYLQKILELVDSGIVSYETESGEVVWMNEAFKKQLGIPYLKTIHSLEKRDAILYDELQQLRNGESKIITILKDQSSFKALVTTATFQTDGKGYRLAAFQNVNEALDETESKAWQRLLSVMTHEIMNSVAPISSLADTLKTRIQESRANMVAEQAASYEDLELGISTIKRRSEGLLKFAETYRSLNKITRLNVSRVFISELFENLHQLMQPTMQQKNIELDIILKDPLLTVEADVNLVEQVLINLVVNAMEAVKESPEPCITLSAAVVANNRTVVKIADNGTGMPEEVVDKIFIPFFSTKKNGSGIGLSLCKQIMMLHKGNIQVQSVEGEGTVFSLLF